MIFYGVLWTVGFLGGEESIRVHKNVRQYLDWVTGMLRKKGVKFLKSFS